MKFQTIGDGRYRLTDAEHSIEFDADRLRRDRGELLGELSVSCGLAGARVVHVGDSDVLSCGTFNFSSPRVRQERAKQLAERARTNGKVDWLWRLEEFCQRILIAERDGRPAVRLRELPRPSPADALDIEGLRLLRDHPSMIFGDGGSAKSYLALFLAGRLEQRGLRVLFADWELAGEDHRDRFERMFGSDMPGVFYARCERPIIFEAEHLARLGRQHESDFLICDSVAFACDGPPEAAEVAARYFQAVRQIGLGSLHVAHTNRSERSDEKPFGSTFWFNGARSLWYAKRADENADTDRITIGLYHKKANLGPRLPAVGYEITFTDERTEFKRVDVAKVGELAAKLPLWARMKEAVSHRAMTIEELAAELDANSDSVDRIARRHKELFTRIPGGRIALLERAS